jgi:hypothetical protein
MLGQSHFSYRTIRKLVVTFGTLFNDVVIKRYNKQGTIEYEQMRVPLGYGPKEKYITRITSDPTLTKSIATSLPRMSFDMTGMSYDSSRKPVSLTRNFRSNTSNSGVDSQFVPIPYDFDFSLSIYCRNIEDGTQIIEQILPHFTPDLTVTVKFIPGTNIKYDVPVILNSVDVYANTAGFRTIEILDAQGNTYADTTINIPASGANTTTVNVNFKLYPGTNYFIKCRGLVDLYRNSAGAVYPYNSASINITGSNAGSPGYYYFFYNWTYTDIYCNTGRTACVALDSCGAVGLSDVTIDQSMQVYPNPTNGLFELSFNASTAQNYKVTVLNTLGEIVYEYQLNDFAGEHQRMIDLSTLSKGVYVINVSSPTKNVMRKITVY